MHDNLQLRTIVIASIICAASGLVTPPEEYCIEDVTRVGKMFLVYSYSFMEPLKERLDKMLDTTPFVAVYWYARNCKRSENILKGKCLN